MLHGETIPSRRVLVVDDEPMVCHAVKMMLEFDGHKVTTVNGPKEALVVFKPGAYDVVLTDFAMPGMTGRDLIKEIHKIDPAQRTVVITAYAEVLPPTGANMVIPKPFMLADLRKALAQLCPEPGEQSSVAAFPNNM